MQYGVMRVSSYALIAKWSIILFHTYQAAGVFFDLHKSAVTDRGFCHYLNVLFEVLVLAKF